MSTSIFSEKTSSLRCSFCGKDNSEVGRLISGPDAYICNGCIDACTRSFAGKKDAKPKPHCSFCHADHREMIAGREALICSSCIELCNEILSSPRTIDI